MRQWLGVVSEDQFGTERLYARDVIAVTTDQVTPQLGDPVALVVAGAPPRLFGHGLVDGPVDQADVVQVRYHSRLFDQPVPVADVPAAVGLHPVPEEDYRRLASQAGGQGDRMADRSVWFVSVALPIEATTRAEAVREFWTYLDKLGPRELPAYVWPLGDELAMQAFVLGAVTNLDPEEDDDAG